MEFAVFPKISTSHSSKDGPRLRVPSMLVAQEKIHGAHFVVGVNEASVYFGKRKGWLTDDDAFFGWQLIRAEVSYQARRIREVLEVDPSLDLYLYGELFGGHYPHPEVAPVQGMSAVQTGIWYCPDIRWSVFDALIRHRHRDDEGYFADQTVLTACLKNCNATGPVVISRGNLADLLQLNVRFQTKVPALFGLPEINNNLAEGIVIKPEGRIEASKRAVYKNKIDEFNEKQFDESQAWDERQIVPLHGLMGWCSRLVNGARVASARSKIGNITAQSLIDEIVLDVSIDLSEAFPQAYAALSEEEQKELFDHISTLANEQLAGVNSKDNSDNRFPKR